MSFQVICRTSAADKAPLCLRTTIHRTKRSHASQVRMLWWWSRQPSEWQASVDEDLQERMKRHQKFMRHKYSKALRRRAMWEREDSFPWSWRSSSHFLNRNCSQRPSEFKPSDPPSGQEKKEPAFTSQRSFQSFQAFVDRQIERDPYGVLFGRRLQGPTSANNSSWTSFSWIFEPKAAKENRAEEMPASKSPSPPDPTVSTRSPESEAALFQREKEPASSNNNEPPVDDEYEYDPITMRKVPKKRGIRLLESLFFEEHGVDIPVKTYKPHKVFGYGAEVKSSPKLQPEEPEIRTSNFESSRKLELSSLMARAKGNTIDTTAQFTDSSTKQTISEQAEESSTSTKLRDSPEPDDSTPLFSGTTYETRAHSADSVLNTQSNWLSREGFVSADHGSIEGDASKDPSSEITVHKVQSKLEPALDRMRSVANDETSRATAKLETSLDRQIAKEGKQGSSKFPRIADEPKDTSQEDIDLLRASDIRAATRAARLTKQDIVNSKKDVRSKLESSFTKHQTQNNGDHESYQSKSSKAAGQISKSLSAVWNHIREYPSGIVAKTMQSMSVFNDDYKKYVKPSNIDFTQKLIFNDKSLSKTPSIFKTAKDSNPKPLTSSEDIQEAEKERSTRTEMLRAATEADKKQNEATNAQVSRLAVDIKAVYEDEYGPIDAEHRQPISSQSILKEAPSPSVSASETTVIPQPHPLSTATVRTGITTNPIIDNHIKVFEPEYAELVDSAKKTRTTLQEIDENLQDVVRAQNNSSKLKALMDGTKELRRELHETGLAIRAIESGRPETVWNAPSQSSTNFGIKRIELTDRKVKRPETEVDSEAVQQAPKSSNNSEILTQAPVSTLEKTAPMEVQEPVFTPSGSPTWNDEQPPPIESLKEKEIALTSAYVILARSRRTDTVEVSPVNEAPITTDEPANPILLLSKLHCAPEYLTHFERLEKAGYELYNGGKRMLIFRKKQEPVKTQAAASEPVASDSKPSVTPNPLSAEPATPSSKPSTLRHEAATVLDEIPTEIEPTPGPAAPTAPPSRPFAPSEQYSGRRQKSRVRRQEKVFSGTIRPSEELGRDEEARSETFWAEAPKDGFWKRLTRRVKRVVLTVAALGGAAYAIGVVAEGVGAQTQVQKGIDDSGAAGPRKRIVLTGQRPGIYSTESSR